MPGPAEPITKRVLPKVWITYVGTTPLTSPSGPAPAPGSGGFARAKAGEGPLPWARGPGPAPPGRAGQSTTKARPPPGSAPAASLAALPPPPARGSTYRSAALAGRRGGSHTAGVGEGVAVTGGQREAEAARPGGGGAASLHRAETRCRPLLRPSPALGTSRLPYGPAAAAPAAAAAALPGGEGSRRLAPRRFHPGPRAQPRLLLRGARGGARDRPLGAGGARDRPLGKARGRPLGGLGRAGAGAAEGLRRWSERPPVPPSLLSGGRQAAGRVREEAAERFWEGSECRGGGAQGFAV